MIRALVHFSDFVNSRPVVVFSFLFSVSFSPIVSLSVHFLLSSRVSHSRFPLSLLPLSFSLSLPSGAPVLLRLRERDVRRVQGGRAPEGPGHAQGGTMPAAEGRVQVRFYVFSFWVFAFGDLGWVHDRRALRCFAVAAFG